MTVRMRALAASLFSTTLGVCDSASDSGAASALTLQVTHRFLIVLFRDPNTRNCALCVAHSQIHVCRCAGGEQAESMVPLGAQKPCLPTPCVR
jgi:hypothetical protein